MSEQKTDTIYIPINEELKEPLIVICPHCDELILLEKLNCCIYRHGVIISNKQQINPHASKEICDNFVKNNEIYGCGKPFRVIKINGKFNTEKCDYI